MFSFSSSVGHVVNTIHQIFIYFLKNKQNMNKARFKMIFVFKKI